MTDKEKVIKGYECCLRINGGCKDCPYWDKTKSNKCERKLKRDAIAVLKEQPQIVRCKDCKYYNKSGHFCKSSKLMNKTADAMVHTYGMDVYDDWFCADGEREKDEK